MSHLISGKSDRQASLHDSRSSLDQVRALLRRHLQLLARVFPRVLVRLPALARTRVVLVQDLLGDTVEQLLGVDAEQVPGQIQRLVDGAVLVRALRDEGALELFQEFEGELVFGRQSLLTDDGFHGSY